MVDLWPAFFLCDFLFILFIIQAITKPKEMAPEGNSGVMRFLKRAVLAIIVMYVINLVGLILLVNYFPWELIETGY